MTALQSEIALTGISFIAGIIGSLLGLGGGFIIVPVLTLFFGVPIELAIGASLIAVIASSSNSAARLVKGGASNIRVSTFLESATTAGAFTGVLLSGVASPRSLYLLFGGVLLYSAYSMFSLRKKEGQFAAELPPDSPLPSAATLRLSLDSSYFDPSLKRTVSYRVKRPFLGLTLMYFAGIVSALLGIGSGVLKIPAMDSAMGLPIKASSATSNLMVGVTSTASAIVYFGMGRILPSIATPVALGILAGSFIGARLLMRIRAESVRWIFVSLLVLLGLQMLRRGLNG